MKEQAEIQKNQKIQHIRKCVWGERENRMVKENIEGRKEIETGDTITEGKH